MRKDVERGSDERMQLVKKRKYYYGAKGFWVVMIHFL